MSLLPRKCTLIRIFLACDMKLKSYHFSITYDFTFVNSGMVIFKSIIALDLETTSLPSLDHNTTKITELAFIGCEVEHLRNSKELPRVLHKLVLLFNPYRLVNPTTSQITGLTNELLTNVKPFREKDVEILEEFIDRLPSPVCLVAHNGDAFDFPILRRAMVKVNKELQNNVYCLDSLKAFRTLLSQADSPAGAIPSHKRTSPSKSPVPLKRTNPVNSLRHKDVCRELFPQDDALSEWISRQEDSDPGSQFPRSTKTFRSYRLGHIYEFYFGNRLAEAHRAENDAKALLGCIMRCQGFLEWMNENAIIFNSVEYLC